jgi:hypothetical protein
MLDVSGSGAEVGVFGQRLDIAKGAACLVDLPGRSGDKGSAPGIEEQPTIPRAWYIGDETNGDGTRRQTSVTIGKS